MDLHQSQCLNHPTREAVARCPECKHFYCRECISEHDDRVICAACLRKVLSAGAQKKYSFALASRLATFCVSLATAWLLFYCVGKILLSIPVALHDGTIWQTSFWQE